MLGVSDDANTNTAGAGEQNDNEQQSQEWKAPASQEDLDRIINQRLARERGKFADYDDLKAKASKFDELEQANKSAEEKAAERLAAAEKRAAELEAKAIRAEVAAEKGVPAALLTGSTLEELEASADALIAFRGEQRPTTPKPDPSQGAKGKQGAGSTAEQFAAFINDQLS